MESSLLLLAASCFLLVAARTAAATETRNVLVLHSNNRLAQGNIEADRGLRAAIASSPDRPVQIFAEFLDQPAFGGDAYERTVMTYLREKYAAQPPDAIVAVSDNAMDFLLRNRARLFEGVPLVHIGVSKSHLRSIPTLPADVVGVPIEYDFSGTIEQALRWHPAARRLVIVTGTSERDRGWEARLRREVPTVAGSVQVEYLSGLPTGSVLQRLSQLGADAVVFTPGYYRDGEGRMFNPHNAASVMAAAATAPMYGPFDTFIGTGVVGGRMPSFEDVGRQAGQIVNELFAGAAPASLRLPEITPSALRVDWRQVRRWGIDKKQIPADAVVYFKEPTFWQAYREEAIITGAVILLQAMLIAMLLLEHRRRRRAESAVQVQRGELWHASRRAIAGELTASIAHEINQPLGAILTNAETGEMLLESGTDRRDDLRRILSDIRRDDLRASDVIRRLRTLLAKHDLERQPFDPNETIGDAMNLVGSEADRRRVTLLLEPSGPVTQVLGDRIQIQQVIINLILNAMDAVAQVPDDRRVIGLSVERKTHGIVIAVRDYGHGIAAEHLPRLFESFFSTKQRGMGLGLSIARTIVESHGGRIWAENDPDFGASFYVELPVYGGNGMSSAKRA